MLRDVLARATPASMNDTSIGVYARLRPGAEADTEVEVKRKAGEQRHVQVRNLEFSLDWVFDEHAPQQDVFDRVAKERVARVLEGYNVCILAYGQTGSGKTHTMFGPDEVLSDWGNPNHAALHGVAPRAIQALFDRVTVGKDSGTRVTCSYVEVYNEELRDLLDAREKKLHIREDAARGIFVDGCVEEPLASIEDAMKLLERGAAARATEATKLNNRSSRSHAILTIIVERRQHLVEDSHGDVRASTHVALVRSKIHCVDLAGSERQAKTQASGDRLKEATKINLSLVFHLTPKLAQ